MAALTIFAITGGVSLADGGPLKENLNPDSTTIKPIEEINKTNTQVNRNHAAINGMQGTLVDMDTKLAKKADTDSVYTKGDVDGKLAKKADTDSVYTKGDVDGKLAKKADKEAFDAEVERSKKADKEHAQGIADNAQAIDDEETRSKGKDTEHDTKIEENKGKIEAEETRSKGKDTEHDTKIAANKAGIKANASAIKHLDSKLNKTTAMMTAMNNVDFQDVNAGEVAIGAGVGHFVGDQAVAVGVAYGVNDDLKVHAKWSGVAGDPHYNAIGGGVTYKFRTR